MRRQIIQGAHCAWIAGLACLGSACSPKSASKKPAAPVPVQVAGVRTVDLPRVLHANGTVEPLARVALRSRISGVLEKVHFREGEHVSAGQLLATLDKRIPELTRERRAAEFARADADARYVLKELERHIALQQQGASTEREISSLRSRSEISQAEAEVQRAALREAEAQLEFTDMRSPINGRIGTIRRHPGSLIEADESDSEICTIEQIDPISVTFALPERHLADLGSKDCPVRIFTADGGQHAGRICYVGEVSRTTGMIALKALFANADKKLWPGQSVEIEVELGKDLGVSVVPSRAVRPGQSGSVIYVVQPDRTVKPMPVQVGRTEGEATVIVASGALNRDSVVVVDGHVRLSSGITVDPVRLDSK